MPKYRHGDFVYHYNSDRHYVILEIAPNDVYLSVEAYSALEVESGIVMMLFANVFDENSEKVE